jgi:hypothetical protein
MLTANVAFVPAAVLRLALRPFLHPSSGPVSHRA